MLTVKLKLLSDVGVYIFRSQGRRNSLWTGFISYQAKFLTLSFLCYSQWTNVVQQRRFDLNAIPRQSWETSLTATYGEKDGCTSNKSSQRRARWASPYNNCMQRSINIVRVLHGLSSFLHRRWEAACVHGSESFRCFIPSRSSSTRTKGKRCCVGPLLREQPRMSSQSASGVAWWTLRTARPSENTPFDWPPRISASICCRRRTGRTCWTG